MACSATVYALAAQARAPGGDGGEDEFDSEPRRPLGVGVFGLRPPGSKSRYRERFLKIDAYKGRRPGLGPDGRIHHAPRVKTMPLPEFVRRRREKRIINELNKLVALARIPQQKLGDAADYREELFQEAFIIAWGEGCTVKVAIDRSEKKLLKLYRELA